MSRSIPRRLTALFLTAGLASLAVATQSAHAADLVGQSTFDLANTGAHTLSLGGGTASKSYSTSWDKTSSNLGTGINKSGSGSNLNLRTQGSVGATFTAAANAGTATLDYKQVTTTTLKDTGLRGQYKFSNSHETPGAASFTTTGPSAFVSVAGSLHNADSLTAKGCILTVCGSTSKSLLSFGASNFPIVSMTTLGGGAVSVAGKKSSGAAGQTINGKFGSVSFGSAGGLTSSGGAASRSDPLLTESLNLLNMATDGGAAVLQGSVNLSFGKVDLGTISYNAGSATINAIESLVQTSTMNVTASSDTFFRDKNGADISLLVKPSNLRIRCRTHCLTPTTHGFYSVHDVSQLIGVAHDAEDTGFLLGDGSVDLGGDQIVTDTAYTMTFQEVLAMNLSGAIDLAALQGKAFGDGFGPVFSSKIDLGGQSWTVYSHTFSQTFDVSDTVVIPETLLPPPPPPGGIIPGGVPEPATWALMLIGFGAVGLTLRRRPYAPLAA
jgi:hypothetical protein